MLVYPLGKDAEKKEVQPLAARREKAGECSRKHGLQGQGGGGLGATRTRESMDANVRCVRVMLR